MTDTTGAAPNGAAGKGAPVSILDRGDEIHEAAPPRRPPPTRSDTRPSEPPRERPEAEEEIEAPAGAEAPPDEPSPAGEGQPGWEDGGDAGGEAEAEPDEGEEPDPEAERERPIRADAKVRLRDGTETTVGDLKRNHEERVAYEARIKAEVSAKERDIDAQRARFFQAAQQYEQQMQLVVQAAAGAIPPEPDPAMIDERSDKYDPIRYSTDNAVRDRAIRQYHARNQQLQQVQQQQRAQFEHERAQAVAQETEVFFSKAPELRQPERMKAFRKEAHEVLGKAYGFRPEELDGNPDHRVVLAYRDLIQFQKWKAERDKNKDALKAKTAGAPPVQRPPVQNGVRQSAGSRDARTVQELRRINRDPNASPAAKRAAGEALLARYPG